MKLRDRLTIHIAVVEHRVRCTAVHHTGAPAKGRGGKQRRVLRRAQRAARTKAGPFRRGVAWGDEKGGPSGTIPLLSKAIRSTRASERRASTDASLPQPLQPASSLPLRSRRLRRIRPVATATPKPATPASSARTTNSAPTRCASRNARDRPARAQSDM